MRELVAKLTEAPEPYPWPMWVRKRLAKRRMRKQGITVRMKFRPFPGESAEAWEARCIGETD